MLILKTILKTIFCFFLDLEELAIFSNINLQKFLILKTILIL